MDNDLEEELFNIEPGWFQQRDDKQVSLMGFGFACGDGWYPIVRSILLTAKRRAIYWDQVLSEEYERFGIEPAFGDEERPQGLVQIPGSEAAGKQIEGWYSSERIEHPNPYHPSRMEIVQVKEKFGGLRFYKHGGDGVLGSYIQQMQRYSTDVCERCGDPGELRPSLSWTRTLCEDCFETVQED